MKKKPGQKVRRILSRSVTAVGGSLARVMPDLEDAYLKSRPDVRSAVNLGKLRSGMHHWLVHGIREHSPTDALRFAGDVARRLLDKESAIVALPLAEPASSCVDAPTSWDEEAYLHHNPDVRTAVECGEVTGGFEHWRLLGAREGRAFRARVQRIDKVPACWNDAAYLDLNPDVRPGVESGFFKTGFEHWIFAGAAEGRATPAALVAPANWDERGYLALNPGVRRSIEEEGYASGYEHYIRVGAAEGRKIPGQKSPEVPVPTNWDEDAYLGIYPEIAASVREGYFRNGFEHWLRFGVNEGRQLTVRKQGIERDGIDGHPDTDDLELSEVPCKADHTPEGAPESWNDAAYLQMYSDVAASVSAGHFKNGYEHWLTAGKAENRCHPPTEGLDPPSTWNERAYLNMNPLVQAGVKSGFFGSGYAHWWAYGRAEGRRAPLATPSWVHDEMRKISAIEPKLFPSDAYFNKAVEHQPAILSKAGLAFIKVLEDVGDRRFSHVMLLPWLKRGGADMVALWHIRALADKFGASVLVVTTEDCGHAWIERLPSAVMHLDFGAHMKDVPEDDKMRALARLLLKLKPNVIHNINSETGWNAFVKHGRALKSISNLFVSLFCFTYEHNGEPVGYPRLLEDVWEHLSGVISDNSSFPDELAKLTGVPRSLFTSYHYPTPSTARFAYRGHAAPRVLWAGRLDEQKRPDVLYAIAKEMPGVIFDVYGTALFEGSKALTAAITGLEELPNVNLCGSFDGFDSIPTREYACMLYTTQYDGLPNIILESLAAGLCVLAPDVGGIAEAIPKSSPFLLPADAPPSAYCKVLDWAVKHPQLVEKERSIRLAYIQRHHNTDVFHRGLLSLPGYLDGLGAKASLGQGVARYAYAEAPRSSRKKSH